MKLAMLTVAVLFIGMLLFGCVEQPEEKTVTEREARIFVEDDLTSKYPDAEVREIIEMNLADGSWYVKARVTYNLSSRCPVRMHTYYDYPKKGFIVSPPEYITKDCVVCKEEPCIIGTPEEAIIASHTLSGTELVNEYLSAHTGAKSDAKIYAEYIDSETRTKYKNVWIVKWFSARTNYGTFIMISDDGEIKKVWQAVKTETV